MPTLALTERNFDEVVEKPGIVLIDFWAEWCAPCRAFAPVFERASTKHSDLTFGKVDTESEPGLAGAFQIHSIPTLMVIRDGIVVFAQPGALPPSALEDVIREVRALDMDEVRAEIDAAEKKKKKGESARPS